MKIHLNRLIHSCLIYLIAVLAILRNYSMLSRDKVYGVSDHLMELSLAALCLIFVIYHIITGTGIIHRKKIYSILVVLSISLCSVAFHRDGVSGGLLYYVFPMTASACFFAFQERPEDFWIKFVNIMTAMAVVSLVLYFAGSVLGIISPTRTAAFWYDGRYKYCNTYFGLQYEAQRVQSIVATGFEHRNCGFFIEAPMYNILLCFAFAAELSFQKKVRKKVLIILAVTIITTMTTTGILFLGGMLLIYFFISGKDNHVKSIRLMLLPVIVLVAASFLISVMDSKMASASGANSASIRIDHMKAFLKMFMDYPLFGTGYGSTDIFYKYTAFQQGYSVGLPALLGRGGIFLFSLYLIPWIRNVLYSFKYEKKQLFFWAGTFVCLFLTAVAYHPIMYMTMTYQLMVNLKTRKVN